MRRRCPAGPPRSKPRAYHGAGLWRSLTTMTALGLVPISAAQSSVRDLDLLGDAAERRDAEVPSGVLRPVGGSRGLTIWWVPGLTRWAEIQSDSTCAR